MQIFIKTLTGNSLPLEVDVEETIENVKQRIHEIEGVGIADLRLLYGGKQLENDNGQGGKYRLSDYQIGPESTLHLVLRLNGGQ